MTCLSVRFLILLLVLGVSAAFAQTPPTPPAPPRPEPPKAQPEKMPEFESPPPTITEHTLALPNGKSLRYKAITGYLLLRDTSKREGMSWEQSRAESAPPPPGSEKEKEKDKPVDPTKGRPKAQIFFVAYVASDSDAAQRPLTFAFNGGPGSSSIWLHLGGLGPRRAQLSESGESLPPPGRLVDNDSSWLEKSDLVFIDPVSTGYSRTAPGESSQQFHGYKEDVENVGDFIRLWTTKNGRWGSPKFIAGESYGTTRAAGLSDYLLDRYGMSLNGIVLIGTVLNFQTLSFDHGNDSAYPAFLPSYTAAAWYHKKLPPDLQTLPLQDVLRQSEQFAGKDYRVALAEGDRLSAEEQGKMAETLARFTGLPAKQILQANLRVLDERFFVDLLKDQNRQVGRYDSRFVGIRSHPGSEEVDSDPSGEATDGPFTSAFYQYLRNELKYESDLPYERIAPVFPWSLSRDRYLDVAKNLKETMTRNPYLQVLVCAGYYDVATPYYGAEETMHGLNLDPAVRNNLQMAFYESGHMLYIDTTSRRKFRNDFDALVDRSLHPAPVSNASRDVH